MKLAIVQAGPVYLDIDKSLEKAEQLTSHAASKGADMVVFGESWLSGYPIWLDICKDVNIWDHEPVKEMWARTYENSIELGSDHLAKLQSIAKSHNIYLLIGANEKISSGKGNRTIYNSTFLFSNAGDILNHHRKLMPTYTEKLVHAQGDAEGLKSVETDLGRIGSLICWEHWMPMARQSMHDSQEDLHVALWPWVKEQNHVASRHYAIEGRCYVVAVGQIMHKDELGNLLEISDAVPLAEDGLILRGGSAVYAPDGSTVLPIQDAYTDLILCEIDMKSQLAENMNLAVSGHYQRFDVFDYSIKRERIGD